MFLSLSLPPILLNVYAIIHLSVPPLGDQLGGIRDFAHHCVLTVHKELWAWLVLITTLLSEQMSERNLLNKLNRGEFAMGESEEEGAPWSSHTEIVGFS